MKFVLFFLGVCLAQAALNPEDLRDRVFDQNKEYRYTYKGVVKSGVPKSSDLYSGMKIEAEVRLQFPTDKDVLMILEKVNISSVRGKLESPEEREIRRLTKDTKDSIERQPEERHRNAFDLDFLRSTEFSLWDSVEDSSEESRRSDPRSEERRLNEQLRRQQSQESRKSSREEYKSSWEASDEVSEEVSKQDMSELRKHLEKPCKVRYEKGNVTKIECQKDEPNDSVNIKRGVWSMFQMTMDPKDTETLDEDRKDKTKSNRAFDKSSEKLFRIMEQDVSGQCETQYDVRESRLQKNLYEVTKTKDFKNCRQRAEKLHSIVDAKKTEKSDDKLESSSVSRLLVVSDKLRSDKFLIQKAESRSQHVLQPYDKEGGEVVTYTKQSLQLKDSKTMSEDTKRIPEPRDSEIKGNLSFVFDQERKPNTEERRQEKTEEKKERIEKLCKEISRHMKHSVSEEAPKKFIQLVKELRQLSEKQMKEILKELITKPLNKGEQKVQRLTDEEVKEKNQTRQVLLDAVSVSGKWEALKAVRELMELRKLSESESEQCLTGLSLSIQPCPSTTREMLEIAKSQRSQESKKIRTAAWLSLGNMIDGMVSKRREGQIKKRFPKDQDQQEEIKREYARELLKGIEEDKPEEEKLIFLRAIRNAGLEHCTDRLKEIILGRESDSNCQEVRLRAIDALEKIAKKLPNKVRQIALRVFQNPEKCEGERIRAYELMMKTKPSLSFLELIAQSTQRETSNQVGQYVYTDMKSLSESKLPKDKEMSKKCKVALRLCKPFNKGIQYSTSRKFQLSDKNLDMGVSLDLKTIMNKKSILPRDTRVQLRLNALGYDMRVLEWAWRTQGVQTMIDSLLNKKTEEKKSIFDYMMKSTKQSNDQYRKDKQLKQKNVADLEIEKIQQKLPIETRREQEPRIFSWFQWFNKEVSFQEWDKEELKKLVREGKLPMSDLEEKLSQGMKSNLKKTSLLLDQALLFSTPLGFPMHLNMTSAVVIKSDMHTKLEVSPRLFREDRPREQKEVRRIETELKSNQTIVLFTIGKMTVVTPVLKSGVAINITLNTTVPVSGKLSMDMDTKKTKLTFETPEEELELLKLNSRLSVFTEEKKVRKDRSGKLREEVRRQEYLIKGKKIQKQPTEFNLTYGREELGLEFRLNSSMISRINKEKTAPYQPLCGPVDLRLSVRPGLNKPKEVEIELEQKETRPSSVERSSERSEEQEKEQRMEINIRANHERQPRHLKIKIVDKQEKVEHDSRLRQPDSRERTIPKKFLVRSPQDKEAGVSQESKDQIRESQKEQTRRSFIVRMENQDNRKFCLDVVTEYPKYADYSLIQDRIMNSTIEAKWGRDCSSDKKLKMSAKFQKSVEQHREEIREEQMYKKAPKDSKEWYETEEFEIPEYLLRSSREETELGSRSRKSSSEDKKYFSESLIEKRREIRENLFRKCMQERRQGKKWDTTCLKSMKQRSQLRELDLEVEHQNLPLWMRQMVSDLHKLLQYSFFDRTSIKDVDVRNEENKIRMRVTVDKQFKEMNVTIKTPREETNITRISVEEPKLRIDFQKLLKKEMPIKMDLSIPVPVRFPNTKESLVEEYLNRLMKDQYKPYCKVQSDDKIRTFDNVEYKYKVSKCDHILAKDASPEEKFLVLISKDDESKPEHTVKVFLEKRKIELRVRKDENSRSSLERRREEERRRVEELEDVRREIEEEIRQQWSSSEEDDHEHKKIEVTIDGRSANIKRDEVRHIREDESDPESKILFTIKNYGDKKVKIISEKHGLMVKHDGHSAWVKVSNSYRSKMAGLCSNFDGEQTREFEGPSQETYKSPKMFALSYQIPSKQCEVEGKKIPVMRNVMITRKNENDKEETCFSKTPVPQCPEGSVVVPRKTEKTRMEFHCLFTNLESTQKMIKLHKTKPLEKMMSKKTDRVQEIQAELECREQ